MDGCWDDIQLVNLTAADDRNQFDYRQNPTTSIVLMMRVSDADASKKSPVLPSICVSEAGLFTHLKLNPGHRTIPPEFIDFTARSNSLTTQRRPDQNLIIYGR